MDSNSKVDVLKKINLGIKSVVFGCSIEAVESYFPSNNEEGLIISCGRGEISDLNRLLDSIAVCISRLEVKDVLEECLFLSLKGESAIEILMSYLDMQSSETIGIPDEIRWIAEDLIAKPLLETLTLGIMLDKSVDTVQISNEDSRSIAPVLYGDSLMIFYRWICIARLIQLILKEFSDQIHENSFRDNNLNSKRSRLNDGSLSTTSGDALLSAVNALVRKVSETAFPGQCKTTLYEDRLFHVLHSWCLFVRNAATIIHKCRPGLISTFPMNVGDDLILALESNDAAKLPFCLDKVLNFLLHNFGSNINLFSEETIAECCKGIDLWMKLVPRDNSFLPKVINVVTNEYYAVMQKPRLKALPDSYTKLHGLVLNVCDYEYPAICLVCGKILDAGGKKDCTNHAAACSPEGSVIFLLQDCTILLLYASRASYYTSPYVDSHGEKHRHYKGRPLFLDEKR